MHDASVSSVVADQQIQGLPINGRNFISFAVITPGVTIDNTPQQGASATSGLSFAGQRARSNSVMVDGLDNNDAALGSVRAVFSQEAVREFQVLTNSYSAEFGKASGGVVNIVTKSGSNEVHGNVFGYFRDDALNSKSHFEQFDVFGNEIQAEKSPFRQYQYGGTLGGPIKKDKTFYFLSFERLDTSDSNLVTISEADAAVLNRAGFEVKTGANPFDVKQTQALAKIDHQWSPNSNLVLRANFSDVKNENAEPFGGLVARSRGGVRLATDYSFSASQTNMLGGRWVNEARIQYARQDQEVNALDPRCGGECTGTDQGGPTLEIGRIAVGRQRFTPQPRLTDRIQVVDTVSLFAGRHQLKAGFDYNYIKNRDALPLQFGGRYIFGSMAAVAAGTPAAYVQGYGNDRAPYSYNDVSVFVQDEWRLSRKLTIKPGVRYQRQFFPDVAYDVGLPGGERYRYAYPEDKNNIAPRLSVSFDPKGNGRTALHASYGIFYDNTLTSTVFITDALDGSPNGVRTLVGAGPVAIAAWNAPDHRLTEAQVLALLGGSYPSLMFAIDPDLKTPYAHQAALGFEQAIGKSVSITVNAIYARGKHQLGTIDFNPRVPALGHPAARPNDVGGRPGTSASILQYTSFGETWYKGVTAAVQKHYRKGSQLLVSYTLSKSEDNSTDFQSQFVPQSMGFGRNPADPSGLPVGGPARCAGANCQLPFDPLAEKGPAVWDQRHRLVASGLYELPGAVQVSAIMTFATGRPFTALAGVDLNGDGNGGAFPPDRARREPGRHHDQRGTQHRAPAQPVHRGRAPQPEVPAGRRGLPGADRRGLQPAQPDELLGREQHLRHWRVPWLARQGRPGARDLRNLHPGAGPAAVPVGRQAELLISGDRLMIFRAPEQPLSLPEVPLTPFLLERAVDRGDKPAFIDASSGRTLTYRGWAEAVRRSAAGLSRRGLRKGDVFAIYSPNLPEYAVAFHAVSLLGGISTTINPLYTPAELAHQLKDSGARYLATVPSCLAKAQPAAQEAGLRELFVFGEARRGGALRFAPGAGRRSAPGEHRSPARPGGASLLQRHHRPAQGRDAQPPQPGVEPPPVGLRASTSASATRSSACSRSSTSTAWS